MKLSCPYQGITEIFSCQHLSCFSMMKIFDNLSETNASKYLSIQKFQSTVLPPDIGNCIAIRDSIRSWLEFII